MRLAVLVSGTGSILEAMLSFGLAPAVVGADRCCRGLDVAGEAGMETLLAPRGAWEGKRAWDIEGELANRADGRAASRPDRRPGSRATGQAGERPDNLGPAGFDRKGYSCHLAEQLANRRVEVVAMAGFGTVLDESFFEFDNGRFKNRVLNTHPSLLPSYPGWHAVRDALASGARVSGCTVHIAVPEVDAGPIVAQRTVPVLAGDDEASLHERIKAAERELYPATIAEFIGAQPEHAAQARQAAQPRRWQQTDADVGPGVSR